MAGGVSKAIGGYIPRSKRRYVPPADGIPRCDSCRARLDLSMWPHFCKEITYGTPLLPGMIIGSDVV